MAEWMKKLVHGAKSGDVLEGVSEPDQTGTEEEKATFKPKKVRLTIVKAEQPSLPPVDDAFAQKVGAPTVASMHESIDKLLNAQAEEKMLEGQREQINEFLMPRQQSIHKVGLEAQ